MSEANLWDRMRKAQALSRMADPRLRMMHMTRVENGVGAGEPDVNYCINGSTGGVELKFRADTPVRENTPVFTNHGLRDSQILWIFHRCKAGGQVYVCTQVQDRIFAHRMTTDNVQVYNEQSLQSLLKTASWTDCDSWVNFYRLLAGIPWRGQ